MTKMTVPSDGTLYNVQETTQTEATVYDVHNCATVAMTENTTRQAIWRRKHPRKYSAHLAVQRALKSGQLIKVACEHCKTIDGRIDAHHPDYSQPLTVIFLCRRCHVQLHKRGTA